MEVEQPHRSSRLMTVRLWEEDLGGGQAEWRGKVQDVGSGEAAFFRDWSGLVNVVRRLLEKPLLRHDDPFGPDSSDTTEAELGAQHGAARATPGRTGGDDGSADD